MSTKLLQHKRERRIRHVNGYITNNGAAAISTGTGAFTIVRNGVGDVSITLTKPGKVFMSAVVTPIETTAATAHMAKLIAAPTATVIRVGTYVADAVDGAPADIDFCFNYVVKDVSN